MIESDEGRKVRTPLMPQGMLTRKVANGDRRSWNLMSWISTRERLTNSRESATETILSHVAPYGAMREKREKCRGVLRGYAARPVARQRRGKPFPVQEQIWSLA